MKPLPSNGTLISNKEKEQRHDKKLFHYRLSEFDAP